MHIEPRSTCIHACFYFVQIYYRLSWKQSCTVKETTKTSGRKKGYPPASIFTRAINVYALRFYPETGVKRSFCKLMESLQLLVAYTFHIPIYNMINILRSLNIHVMIKKRLVELIFKKFIWITFSNIFVSKYKIIYISFINDLLYNKLFIKII